MSRRKARRRPKKTTEPPALPLAERLQLEREQLFRAMSVVTCCRLACASKFANDDPEVMVDALQVAYDLIDQAAGQLGVICDEQDGDDVARGKERS
jgi:hypothetical protein